MRPWSRGHLLQQLRLLEGFDMRALGHNSAAYIHTVTEAAKLAFGIARRTTATPITFRYPLPELLSDTYAAARRPLIGPDRAALDLRPGDPYSVVPCAPPGLWSGESGSVAPYTWRSSIARATWSRPRLVAPGSPARRSLMA